MKYNYVVINLIRNLSIFQNESDVLNSSAPFMTSYLWLAFLSLPITYFCLFSTPFHILHRFLLASFVSCSSLKYFLCLIIQFRCPSSLSSDNYLFYFQLFSVYFTADEYSTYLINLIPAVSLTIANYRLLTSMQQWGYNFF